MRVCIVGNGPSAEGKGREIDACDFVVRMKAYWAHGAADAGTKTNAVAWFGYHGAWQGTAHIGLCSGVPLTVEHWMTHSPFQLIRASVTGRKRMAFFIQQAGMSPVRWLPHLLWRPMFRHLDERDPSTGFVTVGMAIHLFPECDLVLYGFDSTHPELPNYCDARCNVIDPVHNMLLEKKAILELANGQWLGRPTACSLTWPDQPDIAAADTYVAEKSCDEPTQ